MQMTGGMFLNHKPTAASLPAGPRHIGCRFVSAREVSFLAISAERTRSFTSSSRRKAGKLLWQLLLQFEQGREEIADTLQTLQRTLRFEVEQTGIRLFERFG